MMTPEDLRSSGLLWLINRTVFHPRGYALALVNDDEGKFLGFDLQGDGSEIWSFPTEVDDEKFQAVTATLNQLHE